MQPHSSGLQLRLINPIQMLSQSPLPYSVSPCTTAAAAMPEGGLLKEFLHSYLPADAHERCSRLCHVGLTRVPFFSQESISEFKDKDDLVGGRSWFWVIWWVEFAQLTLGDLAGEGSRGSAGSG